MARGTPDQIADKWATNLGGATTSITAGVNSVTVAPGQKAAAQAAVWLQRLTASQDKWKARVSGVTLEQWRAATIAGIPRIAQGAQAKKGKFAAFMVEFGPHLDALHSKLASMPRGDLQTNIQRMITAVNHNAQFKRS